MVVYQSYLGLLYYKQLYWWYQSYLAYSYNIKLCSLYNSLILLCCITNSFIGCISVLDCCMSNSFIDCSSVLDCCMSNSFIGCVCPSYLALMHNITLVVLTSFLSWYVSYWPFHESWSVLYKELYWLSIIPILVCLYTSVYLDLL